MSTLTAQDPPCVSFELPDGRLSFSPGDLDFWAEHLAWCYELLGIRPQATIAVQDFGTSPLAYLGSSLLMPTLEAGVAERLDGQIICLDASPERIAITPEALRQVEPDVLIVRGEVFGLVLDGAARAGVTIGNDAGPAVIVAIGAHPVPLPRGDWRRLLNVEASLLLAPECTACGAFHLRDRYYALDGRCIENLRQPSAASCEIRDLRVVDAICERGSSDVLFTLDSRGEGAEA